MNRSLKLLRLNTYLLVLRQSVSELLCKLLVYRPVENDACQDVNNSARDGFSCVTVSGRFIVQRQYLQVSCAVIAIYSHGAEL